MFWNLVNPGYGPIALNEGVGGGMTWAQWSGALSETQVLDVDFAHTDRHFQDQLNTLADDAGENIALAMDSATWAGLSLAAILAASPELLTNGTFTSDVTSWTVIGTGSVTWDAGRALVTAAAIFEGMSQAIPHAANDLICLSADLERGTVPGIRELLSGFTATPLVSVTATDTYRIFGIDTDTSGSARIDANGGGGTFWVDNASAKKVPGRHGIQSSATLQGKRQAGGVCRYDGADDNHLTTFLAQNGAMTLLYHGTIDAVISATQMFLGASGASANRCWLAVTTAGFIAAGVGSESSATIVGTTDVRGKTIVAALTFDGSTVKLLLHVDGATTEEYSAAQASTPTTSIPFRIGGYNNNGTAAGFAKVDAKSLKAAHKAMTLAEFSSIAAALAA